MREEIFWELNSSKVIEEIRKGIRISGRKFDEYRKIFVEKSKFVNAHGSAIARIGKTEVIAGTMMLPGQPYPDSPDEGSISVGVELMPLASPQYESGPPNMNAIELARVVDRGIREGKALDFKKLSIIKGELAWFVYIDLYVANHSGNLFDASSLAAIAALSATRIPKLEGEKIVKKEFEGKLELKRKPVTVTSVKIADQIVVDPDLAEEKAAQARFSVSTTEDNFLSAFQKGLSGSFTKQELDTAIEHAIVKGKELRKFL